MFLEITGFLVDNSADDSIKFELDVKPEFEQAVTDVLGRESIAAEVAGELPLTTSQIEEIADVIKEPLPLDLDLFIGARA